MDQSLRLALVLVLARGLALILEQEGGCCLHHHWWLVDCRPNCPYKEVHKVVKWG